MWGIICQGAIGTIILIDHSNPNSLEELQYYVDIFKKYDDNIVIGISHLDKNTDISSHKYRTWLIENNLNYPLFFVDARQKDDVLMLLETVITTLEIKYL